MSDEVVRSVSDPAQALLDLERFEDTTSATAEFGLFKGPFGVSRLPQVSESRPGRISPEINQASLPSLPEDWISDLEEMTRQEESDEDPISSLLDTPEDMISIALESWDFLSPEIEDMGILYDTIRPQPEFSPISHDENIEAWSILSHYKDMAVPLTSPLSYGQEEPRSSLSLPCAVNTLGDLSTSVDASHVCPPC